MNNIYEMMQTVNFHCNKKGEKQSMQLLDICDKFDKHNFEIDK